MSVESIITENLDIWTSAIKTRSASGRGSSNKLELYGIKKLRELILELAIRGKLVSQDFSDEPANELLDRVKQIKTDKKLGSRKTSLSNERSQSQFEIPSNWIWTQVGQIGICKTGKTPSTKNSEFFDGSVPFIGPGQISSSGFIQGAEKFLSEIGAHESTEAQSNDILMVCIGGSIGKAAIARERMTFNQQINSISPILCNSKYIFRAITAPSFTSELLAKSTGSATPIINRTKWEALFLPLPPLTEQLRIANKVDELMALCDQLESQTEASIEAHQTLVKSLLETLINAKDADELNESWQRISEHFDVLFTTEDSIDQLKQTILQLAVMGKLVKQDPNDEPASKLLERIEAEKVQLIKDKKIKKQTELKEVNESDFPFSTPEGWAVVRLGALIPQFQNGVSSRGDKKGKETIVLRLADIKDWRISENDTRRLIINEETIEKYLLKKGDTLIIRVNGSSEIVGRFITVEKVTDAIYCDHFIRMRFPIPCIEPNYLAILGSSRLVRDKISDLFISTAGQKTVNQTHISSLTLSIPPIMEQKRISERVGYLVAICDELKSKLQTVQRTISNVADSVKANY